MQTIDLDVNRELIEIVEHAIYRNTTHIVLPQRLLEQSNDMTLRFISELCRLNGLEIRGAMPTSIPIRRRLGLGLDRFERPDQT